MPSSHHSNAHVGDAIFARKRPGCVGHIAYQVVLLVDGDHVAARPVGDMEAAQRSFVRIVVDLKVSGAVGWELRLRPADLSLHNRVCVVNAPPEAVA